MGMIELMRAAVQHKASDIYIVPTRPPSLRINGEIRSTKAEPLSVEDAQQMIFSVLSDQHIEKFQREKELDASISAEDIGRFRINVLEQIDGVAAVLRVIMADIPTPEELFIEDVLIELTRAPRGLVLVTGPTGSGKTTTLACLLNIINEKRRGHILTIEDPIEYVYPKLNCIVTQREVGIHSESFQDSIKRALRQDPDVILLGEMRDLETISAALTLAETGHLVFATMHTADAAQTVERIIDVFPPHQQQQVRLQLSLIMNAVVSQQLMPRADGEGMIAAREIMIGNNAVLNLIRQGNTHELYSTIEVGSQSKMKTLERDLTRLVQDGKVLYETAIGRANKPEMIPRRAGGR